MKNELEEYLDKNDLKIRRFYGQCVMDFIGGPLHGEIWRFHDYHPYYYVAVDNKNFKYGYYVPMKKARYKLIENGFVIYSIGYNYLYSYLFDGIFE